MFAPNTADLKYLFDSAGEKVLINDIERTAIITNPAISEYEERYIHTLDRVSRGDMVTFENENYLVITESISKRGGKYKPLIRHCNYTIKITGAVEQEFVGYDHLGRPVYQDKMTPVLDENGEQVYNESGEPLYEPVYEDVFYVPSIVDNKSFSIEEGAIRLPNNQIEIIVQDNTQNTTTFVLNFEFLLMDKEWKVINQDKSKKGMIILTCERVV